jgi:ribosomal protein S2
MTVYVVRTTAQELKESVGFLGKYSPGGIGSSLARHLVGLRRKLPLFNIEKSVVAYATLFKLVGTTRLAKGSVLFVGCPVPLERFVVESLVGSNHEYISDHNWVQGSLTNKKYCPDLVICFKRSLRFECLKKNIPLASFVERASSLHHLDYPIVANLKSAGVVKMYLSLLKLLI